MQCYDKFVHLREQIPENREIIWTKYIDHFSTSDTYMKTFWNLHDITDFSFKTSKHSQWLEYEWGDKNGDHGMCKIMLDDYPRFSSKANVIIHCNLERPVTDDEMKEFLLTPHQYMI